MKITIDIPENLLAETMHLTGAKSKSEAVAKAMEWFNQYQQRAKISQKFLIGEWSAELKGYEAAKSADRQKARRHSQH